jgi:hypothetical protein
MSGLPRQDEPVGTGQEKPVGDELAGTTRTSQYTRITGEYTKINE